MSQTRSSATVTFSVWRALFLREAVSRMMGKRMAWVWLLVEPLFHISYLAIYHGVLRSRSIGGINTVLWIVVGVLAYYMFVYPARRSMHAISANQALFVYRQIKPVDTVLVRVALEAFLMVIITIVVLCLVGLAGIDAVPDDPLLVLAAAGGLALTALGFGLLASVLHELTPELGKILELFFLPLYVVSGTIFAISGVPEPYRGWMMLNPLAHGIEIARQGFASYYHVVPETDIVYLYSVAIVVLALGLALQVRFKEKLVAK